MYVLVQNFKLKASKKKVIKGKQRDIGKEKGRQFPFPCPIKNKCLLSFDDPLDNDLASK